MDIWVPVLVAIVTGLISFVASTFTSSKEIQKLKIENDSQMQRMKEQHKDDLERLEKENFMAIAKMESEFELKTAQYSKTKETDIQYDFMGDLLKQAMTNPQDAQKSMEGLQTLASLAEKLKGDSSK